MPRDAFEPGDAWEPADVDAFGAEPFPMLDLSAMLRLPKPRFRINGVMPENGLAVLFGQSGSKKSFVAIDWACHIAHGMDWHGHKTRQCGVLYVAGEDGYGVGSQRIPGWHIDQDKMDTAAPLRLIDLGVDLTDKEQVKRLIASIRQAIRQTGFPIGVVVIDTLARSFGARDENSGEAMGLFLAGCKAIQREINGLVLVVHHSGWGDASRTRGHSSLWAATDARYQSESEPGCPDVALKILHLKNGESGAVFGLRTESVDLGTNEDGEHITTLIMKRADAPPQTSCRTGPNRDLSPGQETVLNIVKFGGGSGLSFSRIGLQAATAHPNPVTSKSTLSNALNLLEKKGLIVKTGDGYVATTG